MGRWAFDVAAFVRDGHVAVRGAFDAGLARASEEVSGGGKTRPGTPDI
jgi:hypothetical protein